MTANAVCQCNGKKETSWSAANRVRLSHAEIRPKQTCPMRKILQLFPTLSFSFSLFSFIISSIFLSRFSSRLSEDDRLLPYIESHAKLVDALEKLERLDNDIRELLKHGISPFSGEKGQRISIQGGNRKTSELYRKRER